MTPRSPARVLFAVILAAVLVGQAGPGNVPWLQAPTGAVAHASGTIAKPVITSHPVSRTATAGTRATFTVGSTGTGRTTRWQVRVPGGTWGNTSVTGSTLTVTATIAHDGRQYRAVVRNSGGQVFSRAATLWVTTPPKITTQPASVTAAPGTSVTFGVAASGGHLSYRWQIRKPGGSWTNVTIAAASTPNLRFTATSTHHGNEYRVVVTNHSGKTASAAASLRVPATITSTGGDRWRTAGTITTISPTVVGNGLSYQWQFTEDFQTWTDVHGAQERTLTLPVLTAEDNRSYRLLVRNSAGSTTSSAWRVRVVSTPDQPYSVGKNIPFPSGWYLTPLTVRNSFYSYATMPEQYVVSMVRVAACLDDMDGPMNAADYFTVTLVHRDGDEYGPREWDRDEPLDAIGDSMRYGECPRFRAYGADVPLESWGGTVWKFTDRVSGTVQYLSTRAGG